MKLLLNKLQLDLLRRHIGPFVFCFFTVMFLLLMQFLILHIDKLIGKGLPFGIIVELILTNLAYMVVLAAPMAVLVSSLMAFGKFAELNELTAMRAAGVNPIKVINPVLMASVLLCIFLIWFSNDVLPDANQRARSLFLDIRMKKPGFDLQANEFYEGIEGYTFLVREIASEGDSLYNVTLFQEASNKEDRKKAVIKAKRGTLTSNNRAQSMTLYLFDGSVLRYLNRVRGGKKMVEETHFDKYRISFDLSDLAFSRSNPEQRSRNDRTMSSQAMLAVVDSLRDEIRTHKKSTYNNPNSFHLPGSESLQRTLPFRLEHEARAAGVADTLQSAKSRFVAVNMMDSRRTQIGLTNIAVSSLRDYQSNLENLQTNVQWRISRIAQYLVEVHKKYSIPFSCIVFVLLAAPIGIFTKRGNLGYAALISTGFLTFYWISLIQGEKLADRLFITPFTGMWFSNILLVLIGIYLVVRVSTSFKFSNLWARNDAEN